MRAGKYPHKSTDRVNNECENPIRDGDAERHCCWYAHSPQEEYHARFAHAPASQSDRHHGDQKRNWDKGKESRKVRFGMECSRNCRKGRNPQQMSQC